MNINCVICSDMFNPAAEVYVTQCGHMFHFNCLINWIERSKTCPQCRCKCSEKTIHRVYFNLANTDGITDDVGTLMSKLETAQFQLSLKEKDVKIYNEKYKKTKQQTVALRQEVKELEEKIRVQESAMHALKEQASYFKSKSRETERLSEEVIKLKNNIKNMENVQLAINGTREQVNDMLRNERNLESLALLAATLKKSLIEAERRKHDMEYGLKRAQNDANKYRREVTSLECQNKELKKEVQCIKENFEKEKQYLKNKIAELNKKISEGDLEITNTSIKRIINESPVNFNRKAKLTASDDILNETASPSMTEKVQQILDSDSPYLPVKSSNVPLDYTSILSTKTKIGSSKNGYSIFKPPMKTLESIKSKTNANVVYNGLGSSSKEDVFPSPRPLPLGLKRPKSSSSVSSSKFRKLAPGTAKVTNFFNQSSTQ